MRSDMAKVIVERPRIKGCAWKKPKGYCREFQRLFAEGLPIREGMKRRWKENTKYLNEHLGPLRRYLDSQVGRPWDKVFSEICAHINRNSAVQDHVRDHVEDYVITHVFLVNGVPCSGEPGYNYGQPLAEIRWPYWYVCPRSGILKRIKRKARKKRAKFEQPAAPMYIRVGDSLHCRQIDGAWHLVELKPLPLLRDRCDECDIISKKPVRLLDEVEARRLHGDLVYAVSKRRLAKRELRNYPIPVDAW